MVELFQDNGQVSQLLIQSPQNEADASLETCLLSGPSKGEMRRILKKLTRGQRFQVHFLRQSEAQDAQSHLLSVAVWLQLSLSLSLL